MKTPSIVRTEYVLFLNNVPQFLHAFKGRLLLTVQAGPVRMEN
jgi:hypothetical protein